MPLEREHSLPDAERRIDSTLNQLGLHADIQRHGDTLCSTVVTLHGQPGRNGERVGCGKGEPDEARVGAKFEAYEHFHSIPALRMTATVAEFSSVVGQPALADTLPVRMIAPQPARHISVLSLDGGEQGLPSLEYPVFLIDHTYAGDPQEDDDVDYRHARRYACGTGIAVGIGDDEALTHAVGEVIERHAVGLWIARTYYRTEGGSEHEIDPASLPASLTSLLRYAGSALQDDIVLSHARSDIDCPVVVARCRHRTIAGLHVAGSGASVYGEHAATRAIKELVQQYKVAEGEAAAVEHWQRCARRLRRSPRLQPCLALVPGPAKQRIPFADLAGFPVERRLPLRDHLAELLKRCQQAERPVWTRVLRREPSGVVLGCAVMPRMERFAVAALGGVVVPAYG